MASTTEEICLAPAVATKEQRVSTTATAAANDESSPLLSSGNVLFTLLGFAGMYAIASMLYLLVMAQEIARGPGPVDKL